MENGNIAKIKHNLRVMMEMAENSRTMSIGAKLIVMKKCNECMDLVERVELELMIK